MSAPLKPSTLVAAPLAIAALALAGGAATSSAMTATAPVGGDATRSTTLRFLDKPTSMVLHHPDGTVDRTPPYPAVAPGDQLDVYSLLYRGDHRRHAERWLGSRHLRCTFGRAKPECESTSAIGGSLLVLAGEPGTIEAGTGRYAEADGRVIASAELEDGATDVVVRIER